MDRDAVDVGGSNKTLKHASAIYLADQAPDPDCSRTREKLDSNRSIVLEVRLSFFFFFAFLVAHTKFGARCIFEVSKILVSTLRGSVVPIRCPERRQHEKSQELTASQSQTGQCETKAYGGGRSRKKTPGSFCGGEQDPPPPRLPSLCDRRRITCGVKPTSKLLSFSELSLTSIPVF